MDLNIAPASNCTVSSGSRHQDELTNRTYAAFRRSNNSGRCKNASATSTERRSFAEASAWNATALETAIAAKPAE